MNKNMYLVLSTLIHILSYIRSISTTPTSNGVGITGMIVLGDSILDNGNNNFLKSKFRVNYRPYGADFPINEFSTGRFTNAKNPADLIGDILGLPLLPPFMDPITKGLRVCNGVNHASGGSGILNSTGSDLGIISMNQQIKDFVEVTLPMLKTQGCLQTNTLEQYLFLISTGSNDFLLNFLKGGYNIGTLAYFSGDLITKLARQITVLYNSGARKFAFIEIGPFGCSPLIRSSMPNNTCNSTLNFAAYLFNKQLVDMLNTIKPRLPDFQFVAINFFQIGLEFIVENPPFAGFEDVSKSCCEVPHQASDNVGGLCKKEGNVCNNRSKYLFFDGLHPSENLYKILATRAYNSTDPTEVIPFNLKKLAQM